MTLKFKKRRKISLLLILLFVGAFVVRAVIAKRTRNKSTPFKSEFQEKQGAVVQNVKQTRFAA